MSYEDTNCPCGEKKERETMLCAACLEYLKDRKEFAIFQATREATEYRRHAALILISLARKRKRTQEIYGKVGQK